MAEFCWQCLEEGLYPEHPERNDFHGCVQAPATKLVLCEGCGVIRVDHEGRRVGEELPIGVLEELRLANVARLRRWHGDASDWSGADWSNAMAGECGEACNIVKKLRRHETGLGTSYNTPAREELLARLAAEIADVVIYADLLAHHYGFELPAAIAEKFNLVSEAQGFPERVGT